MKSANNEKWEFSDDDWQFQTRSNTIILLSFRRTVIEAVYNKLNPYRSDDTVSIQTFFYATLLPLSFAWLGIRMPFGKWPASLTGCLHPLNKISKPNIFFVKLNRLQNRTREILQASFANSFMISALSLDNLAKTMIYSCYFSVYQGLPWIAQSFVSINFYPPQDLAIYQDKNVFFCHHKMILLINAS